MSKHRPVLFPLVSILVGVALAGGLVLGLYGPPPLSSPGIVMFDGIHLNISYIGGAPMIFGSVHQNACQQSVPAFDIYIDCPANLTGGSVYTFQMFELFNPGNASFAYLNMSLSSPIAFQQWTCFTSLPLPAPTHHGNLRATMPAYDDCGWEVTLAVPDPVPTLQGGIWMDANLTVSVP